MLKQNTALQKEQRDSELRWIRKQMTNFALIYAEQEKKLCEQVHRKREIVSQNLERSLENAAKRAALRNNKPIAKVEPRNKGCALEEPNNVSFLLVLQ